MAVVGIISDTHGRLKPGAIEALAGVDHIIHAGDIGLPQILLDLEAIAPVTAVLGNNDHFTDFGPGVDEEARISIGGVGIFVTHYPKVAEKAAASGKYGLVIHGHSHVPRDEMLGECRVINPGGAFRPRCGSKAQLVIVTIEDGAVGAARAVEL